MAKNFASLGELLPDTDMRCRVKGCNNLWSLEGREILDSLTAPAGTLPERMCESCFETFKKLQDLEVQCAAPDCSNTWRWNRFQQLEAHARGFSTPPQRLCKDCQAKKQDMAVREVPCRMPGCTGTWSWSPQQQMTWRGDKPPQRLCDSCYQQMQDLQDAQIPCRMRGCQNAWMWNRFQQLEHQLAGKPLDKPPRRMCEECFARLAVLEDQELKCRAPGCDRTWTFNRFAQLENRLEHGPDADPPKRLCEPCFKFYRTTRDRRIRCRIRGCSNSWPYPRARQLADWLAGRKEPPEKICEACQKEMLHYHPQSVDCAVPGCAGSWIYTPEEQLKDMRLKRKHPNARRCNGCEEFLTSHQSEIIKCADCGADITWSAYEQLLFSRGTFRKPTTCPGCAAQGLAERRTKETTPQDHHHVVRMPSTGRWGSDPRISQWPPRLNHDTIGKAEKADLRIVALGDAMTLSSETREESWPFLLEQILNRKLADEGLSTIVVNAGMPETTSHQALTRLPRDVQPFAPHLVLVSFICGDALLSTRHRNGEWQAQISPEAAAEATRKLLRKLRKQNANVIYWTPNPVFPQEMVNPDSVDHSQAWAAAQQNQHNQMQTHTIRICHTQNIPVLDLHSRFEVNGRRSARKWMRDWRHPNPAGARNIATWMADYILTHRTETLGM